LNVSFWLCRCWRFLKRMKRSWVSVCIRNAALIKYNLQFAGGHNFPTKGRDSKGSFVGREGRWALQDVNKEGAWRLQAMKMFRPKQQKSMFRGNNGRCTNVILWSRPNDSNISGIFSSEIIINLSLAVSMLWLHRKG